MRRPSGETVVSPKPIANAQLQETNTQATRETVESIVVAIILAFLFRGFVAEAFVIPTGSMAPTLRGRHMDIDCPECGFQYNTGASMENIEEGQRRGEVSETCCPICHFTLVLDKESYPNQRSFNGDRILVSKFAYQIQEPARWDVIVFKYPGNAKQNYIKRLVGLPGETLQIRHGDIHTLDDRGVATIVRKPPHRLKSMLHVVDDTAHIAESLRAINWPSRWQPVSSVPSDRQWRQSGDDGSYLLQSGTDDTWLRYRHLTPHPEEWNDILEGTLPSRLGNTQGELITDYYSYNDFRGNWESTGMAWVGDLAVECDVRIESEQGELLLDLVEGGSHHECRIDLATGQAVLTIRDMHGDATPFDGANAEGTSASASRSALTPLKKPGKYQIRFANCDDQLVLWINNKVMVFDGPTTYQVATDRVPQSSVEDPGDLAPVGIGGKNADITVNRLRVLRDIYYLAQNSEQPFSSEYDGHFDLREFASIIADPKLWESTRLFQSRRSVTFQMGEDQFFPLGDNSPQSKDARLWSEGSSRLGNLYPPPHVDRELLIGKALVVYWPHGWRPNSTTLASLTADYAFIPNFRQMKLIR